MVLTTSVSWISGIGYNYPPSGGGVATWTNVGYVGGGVYLQGSPNPNEYIISETWIGTVTSTGASTITLSGGTSPPYRGLACQQFNATGAGTWSTQVSNESAIRIAFTFLLSDASGLYSANETGGAPPITPLFSSSVQQLFIGSLSTATGGNGGSTAGYTYINYGTSTYGQMVYKTNVDSSASCDATWTQTSAGAYASCTNILQFTLSASIVMLL